MTIIVLFALLLFFLVLSVPIGITLGLSTLITVVTTTNISTLIISQNAFAALDSFPLMAIPFFILAGQLMKHGGLSERLLNLANSLVGFMTGGLAMVTTVACMFFAAISGSAPATVSAIGSFMVPSMKERGYATGFAAAITAAGGTIGVIIPPSIPFVIYGVVTGTSIGTMFIAGIIPGIMIGIALMVASYYVARREGYRGIDRRPTLREILQSLNESKYALMAPIIILGGIYGGIFTPTEAAVVAVVYGLIIGIFVHKELGWEEIYSSLRETVLINGATTFMIGLSISFAHLLTMEQVPATIANILFSISESKIVVLLLINLFLLFVGCFIDNISSCIILAPMLLPVVSKLGIHPIHFGIFMTVNLAVGFITPPYGANLFVASAVAGIQLDEMLKYIFPFIIGMVVVLLLLTFLPWFSMFLPGLMG
ncbi:MAG: TRAP transporter large permease [bacterium]|jgi:C4-dicarboxylate transporter DctM subunit